MLYELTKLRLDEEEFFNLLFMNAPSKWENDEKNHKFLLCICKTTLKDVVEKVINKSGIDRQKATPTQIFESIDVSAIGEPHPWFYHHAEISRKFDKNKIGDLWIRNLSNYPGGERENCPNGSFYLDDGNHRALVYALYIKLGKMVYSPVDAMHATSWDIATGVLGFRPERTASLEHQGKLQHPKHLIKKVTLPIGIEINTYKRGDY